MIDPVGVTFNEYSTAIKNGNYTHARVVFPVQNLILEDEDISMDGGITITTDANPDDDIQYNTAVCSEIIIHIINSPKLNGINWSEEFHVDFGVEIEGVTYWVTVGYFTGTKPKRVIYTEIIEFVAYDRMRLFEGNADEFLNNYSFDEGSGWVRAHHVVRDICEYLGVPYNNAIPTYNTPSIYGTNPFQKGLSYRDVIAMIGESLGCYVYINHNGELSYKYCGYGGFGYNYNIYSTETFNIDVADERTAGIDAVRYVDTTYPDRTESYPANVSTGNIYYIVNNPVLRQAQSTRGTTLNSIYNDLTSFGLSSAKGSYVPIKITTIGNWLIEIADIIFVSYYDYHTKTYPSSQMPICRRTLTWNGACIDTYENPWNINRAAPNESDYETLSTSNIANNLLTNDAGFILDARQGKALSDMIENKLKVYTFTLPNDATRTLTISGTSTCSWLAMTAANFGSNRGMWMLNRRSSNEQTSGNVIMEAANVTVGVGQTNNVITFTKSGTYATYLVMILYYCSSSTPPTITAT